MVSPTPYSIWRVYLRVMLVTLLAAVAAVGAINAFIDPLGVFDSPRIPGLNATKPYLDHHREFARWQSARRACASVGIFGNSRAEIGFDPGNPAFAGHGLTAFNHAIPGTGVNMAYRQLNWLRNAGCAPKTIILGVEFFDFLGSGAMSGRSAPRSVPMPSADFRFWTEVVFSLTGLRDSINTILLQRDRHAATITPLGFNPLANYIPEVETSGHYVLFRQRAEENLKNWLRKEPRITSPGGGQSADYAGLEAFLSTAAKSADTVHLVIYPYHAEIRLMMERLGLGGLFAEWKRSMLSIADRLAAEGISVQVWDFSGIHDFTLEPIPPRGDHRTQMRFYWEAGHFKKALGDHVVARLLGENSDFGVRLQEQTVGAWLDEDRAQVHDLLAKPSALRTEVDQVLDLRERVASRTR